VSFEDGGGILLAATGPGDFGGLSGVASAIAAVPFARCCLSADDAI